MPSVFAKVEKQNSLETMDPLKQVQSLVEKKIRNLEKRKGKLEQLKEEQQSGKLLHDDQKKAINRFDEVIEMLDFFKEFNKNVGSIFAEHSKLVKKTMKKEQVERQQQEVERLKTVILFQDLLNAMGSQETRNDFLRGVNGALQLNDEKLKQLDELYKLVIPDRSRHDEQFTKQLDNAAERWMFLVEGKNREAVKGSTYKDLKDLLTSISVCGYFTGVTKADIKDEKIGQGGDVMKSVADKAREESEKFEAAAGAKTGGALNCLVGQLADSQNVSSGFSFLQESRLDLEGTPHMDPAVVAMAPVATAYTNQFVGNAMNVQNAEVLANQMASVIPMTSTTSTQKTATTYEPINSHQPIPTQTFTNQNFAAMMATTFVPAVTIASSASMALGLPVQHIPVQSISPHHTTSSPDMLTVQDPNQSSQQMLTQQMSQAHITNYQDSNYSNYQMENRNETNVTSQDNSTSYNDETYGQNQQQQQQQQQQGQGYRSNYRPSARGGRGGRGSSINGHSRGSSRPVGNRGFQSGSSFGNNGYNANGPYYGNSDKRGLQNASNQQQPHSGKTSQANRAAGRSAGQMAPRNTAGNYGNK